MRLIILSLASGISFCEERKAVGADGKALLK
jgi:hypothetical protein